MCRAEIWGNPPANRSEDQSLDQRILVLAPTGRDAEVISQVLSVAGFHCERCGDFDRLCGEIRRGGLASVVTEEALPYAEGRYLLNKLPPQPSWSDFPLVILTSRLARGAALHQLTQRRGSIAHLALVERPCHTASLVSAVRVAASSRWRQYQIRDELKAREQTEAALRMSEARMRAFLENSAVIAWLKDAQGRYVFLSKNYEKRFGIRSSDWIGKTDAEIWPRGIAVRFRQNDLRVLEHGAPIEVVEEAKNADGSTSWWLSNKFPIKDFGGELCVGGLAVDVTETKQAEARMLEWNKMLEERVAEGTAVAERRAKALRRLTAQLSDAEHRERQRLARILHDGLQQLLVAAKLRLPDCQSLDREQLDEKIHSVHRLIDECIASSRNLAMELSPPVLQYGSLAEVIEWLQQWFAKNYSLTVDIQSDPTFPVVPRHVQVFLFETIRELLLNVVKHSHRNAALLRVIGTSESIHLQIDDEGVNFDPSNVTTKLDEAQSIGLLRIRERLELLKGEMQIARSRTGGASFRLIVPVVETEFRSTSNSPDRE